MNSLTTVTSGVTTSPILVKSDGWLLIQPASGATATVEYTLDVGNIVTVGSATWVSVGAFTSNTALRVEEELQDLYVRITSASGSCTYSVEGELSAEDRLIVRYYDKRYLNSISVTYTTNPLTGGIGLSVGGVQVGGTSSPYAFTSRALTEADNGQTLVCASSQTATVNTGLPNGFGCAFKGTILFAGTATVTDVRTTGATNPWCALTATGTDTYDVVGTKA